MKPSTRAVLELLRAHPDGLCRRDFARRDFYEVSARIGELRADGYFVETTPCRRHRHRSKIYTYRLVKDVVPA